MRFKQGEIRLLLLAAQPYQRKESVDDPAQLPCIASPKSSSRQPFPNRGQILGQGVDIVKTIARCRQRNIPDGICELLQPLNVWL